MADVFEYSAEQLIPTQEECSKIVDAMLVYEAAKKRDDYESWKSDNKNWNKTPWGISWNVGKAAYDKKVAKGWNFRFKIQVIHFGTSRFVKMNLSIKNPLK